MVNNSQRSKLRPFWSPWRVEKKIGDQNCQEGRQFGDLFPDHLICFNLHPEIYIVKSCSGHFDDTKEEGKLGPAETTPLVVFSRVTVKVLLAFAVRLTHAAMKFPQKQVSI